MSVPLRTPACKPVSTPTAPSSAAVTQDMNLRMMVFVAVVMGFGIWRVPSVLGVEGLAGWCGGQGLPSQVFPLLSQTSPVWDISPHGGVTTTQSRDESLPERWSRVPSLVIWHLMQKPTELPLGSDRGLKRERSCPILCVGLNYPCPALTVLGEGSDFGIIAYLTGQGWWGYWRGKIIWVSENTLWTSKISTNNQFLAPGLARSVHNINSSQSSE